MAENRGSIIRFWPHSIDKSTASFRMRCEAICGALKNSGMDVDYSIEPPAYCDTLVLSYRHDIKSLAIAGELREKYKTKIILDIVDNHFVVTENITETTNNALSLREAIRGVDAIITSSQYMKSRLQDELETDHVPIHVIDDLVEPLVFPKYTDVFNYFPDLAALYNLERKLKRLGEKKSCRIVWYGNHGGDHPLAGMCAVPLYRSLIEEASQRYPLSLTIISNSREKYKELIECWKIPTFYLEWSMVTISKALMMHGIAILPINKNVYTLSKSANRVTKSLAHGLQVVSDEVPSYTLYSPYIYLDEPRLGLWKCLEEEGKDLSGFNYNIENFLIFERWREVLRSI